MGAVGRERAAAGTPVNAIDDYGFTPLMYAVTLDYGDTKTLTALLIRDADPLIADFKNRTPLQQAKRLNRKEHEAVLRAAKVTK